MIKEFIFVILVGALANMVPVFVKKWKFLGYPVDFGLKFKGCRVFGSNKTWRGLFWGILISWYVLSIFVDNFNWDVSYYLGLWIPIGVLGGDLVGSFIKRQCKVGPGEKFFPWDQLDSVIGLVVVLLFFKFSLVLVGLVVLVWFGGHIGLNYIGYLLKLKKDPL